MIKIKITQNASFPKARRLIEIPFIKPTLAKIKTPQNPNKYSNKNKENRKIDKPNEWLIKTTISNTEKTSVNKPNNTLNNYYQKKWSTSYKK